jgi:hypothetical protein
LSGSGISDAVGDQLGQFTGDRGPYFGFRLSSGLVDSRYQDLARAIAVVELPNRAFTWAIATEVSRAPEPATAVLLAPGLAGAGLAARRQRG